MSNSESDGVRFVATADLDLLNAERMPVGIKVWMERGTLKANKPPLAVALNQSFILKDESSGDSYFARVVALNLTDDLYQAHVYNLKVQS